MYFEVGDDAQVIVLRDDIAEEDLPEVDEAVRACPVNALRLVG